MKKEELFDDEFLKQREFDIKWSKKAEIIGKEKAENVYI